MKNLSLLFSAFLLLQLTTLAQEGDCPKIIVYEGKTYNTIQIGDQCWLKENLDIGTMIQGIEEMSDNGIIEKYCYDNDSTNCETYGGLYQWNEAMQYSTTPGVQGICPEGWHIPTYTEFQSLIDEVSFFEKSLIARGQGIHIDAGTLTSGFSALLAGNRFRRWLLPQFRGRHCLVEFCWELYYWRLPPGPGPP